MLPDTKRFTPPPRRRSMAAPSRNSPLLMANWDRTLVVLWLANLLYAIAILLLVYALLFLVIHLPLFSVRQIDIRGELRHVARSDVERVVAQSLHGNFFALSLEDIRAGFEKLPWIRSANIRRRWPDRLEVTLEEHVPIARWGNQALIDSQGNIFRAPTNEALPQFIGPEGSERDVARYYAIFRDTLAPLQLEPVEIVLSPRHAWQIKLKDAFVLELGRDQIDTRLARFAQVYERTIKTITRPISYVDLRYTNGFAVRLPGLVIAPKNKAKTG